MLDDTISKSSSNSVTSPMPSSVQASSSNSSSTLSNDSAINSSSDGSQATSNSSSTISNSDSISQSSSVMNNKSKDYFSKRYYERLRFVNFVSKLFEIIFRFALPYLNKEYIKTKLSNAKDLSLFFDGTPTMNGSHIMCIGFIINGIDPLVIKMFQNEARGGAKFG